MKLRIMLSAVVLMATSGVVAVGLAGTAGTAGADPTYSPLCPNEATATALSGNYHNLSVTGSAYVASGATLTVSGSLEVTAGSCLDAFSMGVVQVAHNVTVDPGATLALGCTPFANDAPEPCTGTPDDTVGGNISANDPLTMYLTAVTVGGNVTSNGGGFSTPGLNFPVKNMSIGGNLVLTNWQGGPGAWIGALRNTVGGNMIVTGNTGLRGDPNDSTEVVGNTVGKNLICQDNTPPAQYGDAYGEAPGNGPNTVAHQAIGECAGLTTPESNT